uniref:hypothetical protein n=1 Tax=Endozoicomonas sp. ONNA1 TaxID=2828740 RepID=UPI0021497583
MNAAHGMRVNASPCPQPHFDTRAATASGQWSSSQPTRKLLPRHPRESERQELLWAAESGRLAIRRIELSKEKNYFSGKGAPRPFTLALPGKMMPTEHVPQRYGKWMVGIIDPQCLYVYKRNARTRDLLEEPDSTPEKLTVKLLPHLQSLLGRRLERGDQVIWRVYPLRFTSGHLQPDGTFSLPKLKFGSSTRLDYPELVLTGYSEKDIKCFCVYNDAQINIADILQDKRECEQVLELEPLPLVVYCHQTGSVQVYFDDELDSKHLARNEHSLNNFAFLEGIAPKHFRAVLNLLPMSLRAETLSSESTDSANVRHKLRQAITLVSDPDHYSYEKLLELKQSGLPIHQRFFHEGTARTLLDMLLTSEELRKKQPEHGQTQEHEEEAYRILKLLLHSGARLDFRSAMIFNSMLDGSELKVSAEVMNYMVAAFAPFDFLNTNHLRKFPLTSCPGNVVEFDRVCQDLRRDKGQIQKYMEAALLDVLFHDQNLDMIKSRLLALFHYGTHMDKEVLHRLKVDLNRYYRDGKKVINNFSVADYIQWVEKLWTQRETNPFYQNWPEHVRQAQEDIRDLKKSLGPLDDSGASTTPLAARKPVLQLVVDAFSKAPVMPDNAGDNEKTILKVLQHYYRRPGPERVIRSLGRQTMPTVWKPLHSCSHVLRARNNGHWYMELLEKFQLCYLSPEEKQLMALAIIYHDAAAEDVDKSAEETRSAYYFKRDLAGHYPEPLLDDIALAMDSKENDVNGKDEQSLPEPLRWYLRILRFADRMDIIRGCGVGDDFPGFTLTRPPGFDAGRLDLPPQLTEEFTAEPGSKNEFQRHLEAAMHGAADLAQ